MKDLLFDLFLIAYVVVTCAVVLWLCFGPVGQWWHRKSHEWAEMIVARIESWLFK